MVFYTVLAVATLFSLVGLGLISLGLLIVAWILNQNDLSETFPESHRNWVKRTAGIGIAAHLALLAVLVVKAGLVVLNDGDGWFGAMVGHWFLDHIGEALISIWLAFRTVLGGVNLYQGKSPEHVGRSASETM